METENLEESLQEFVNEETKDETSETEELSKEEEVTESETEVEKVEEEVDEEIVDKESGKPWKNQAGEYRKKYRKTLEELEQLKTGKVELPKKEEKDPALQELNLGMLTDEQWEKAEEFQGTNRNVIVDLHNKGVKIEKLSQKLIDLESNGVESSVLGQVEEEIRDSVRSMVDKLNVNKNDKEAYKSAVNMAVLAVKGQGVDMKEVEKDIKKKLKEDKKIVAKQIDNAPPKEKKKAANISSGESQFAGMFGLTDEEYAKNK